MDVLPNKQNIDTVFGNITYYIDFYQRDYKWNEIPVKRLLDDIFFKFEQEYEVYKTSNIEIEKLIESYSWYYLNTYVTNAIEGKTFIVDGQQRLTTLTLILLKIYHISLKIEPSFQDWLKSKIAGFSGRKQNYWMNHEKHIQVLEALFKGEDPDKIDCSSGITAINMVNNYKTISKYLDRGLADSQHKFESFIYYFLKRLVLINLNVEQTDVPMVFEVINDRGVRLKPYEILKGKLLGEIKKTELEALKINEKWDSKVHSINKYKEDEIDDFFIYYLRAKYADTRGEGRKFDKEYHRVMYSNDMDDKLQLNHNEEQSKNFVLNEFSYFTSVYNKILKYQQSYNDQYKWIFFNNLTNMNTQSQLILSSCKLNDIDEDNKVIEVAKQVDRLFCLLQLQRSYDSNAFTEAIFDIGKNIRDKNKEDIKSIFDSKLKELLTDIKGISSDETLNYGLFKDTGIELDKRFKRYFFARIELFLAENTNMQMRHNFYDLVQNTGYVNGFHVEHILAHNEENKKLFENEEIFEKERNRLGALLLLKGNVNQSSNNETYAEKLKTYSNTLYWNETLREDNYKSKKDFEAMMIKFNLKFRPINNFGPEEVEERQKLLFDIVKIIWG